jgi:hypothetical protein
MTKTMILSMLLLMPQKQSGGNLSSQAMSLLNFFDTGKELLEKGAAFWEAIGQIQAKDTLQKAASDAANMSSEKHHLAIDIENGDIKTYNDIRPRIDALRETVARLQGDLKKFSEEIDASTGNTSGNKIREAADSLLYLKDRRLYEVEYLWQQDGAPDRKLAVEKLNVAILCSEEIATVTGCLKRAADSGRVDPDDDQCRMPEISKAKAECEKEVNH